jgi:hypothetical protein
MKYILVLLTLIGCYSENKGERFSRNLFLAELIYFSKPLENNFITYTYKALDLNNGQIEFLRISNFGNVEKSNFQRCLLGQIYRVNENDCRGTGNKTDKWGAQGIQWCNENSNICQDTFGLANNISPAATACLSSSFLSKKWKLPGDRRSGNDDFLGTYISYLRNDYEQKKGLYLVFEDYLQTTDIIDYHIWTNSSSNNSEALTIGYDDTSGYKRSSSKTNQLNVICKENL